MQTIIEPVPVRLWGASPVEEDISARSSEGRVYLSIGSMLSQKLSKRYVATQTGMVAFQDPGNS